MGPTRYSTQRLSAATLQQFLSSFGTPDSARKTLKQEIPCGPLQLAVYTRRVASEFDRKRQSPDYYNILHYLITG
jgi:hypothetical protein